MTTYANEAFDVAGQYDAGYFDGDVHSLNEFTDMSLDIDGISTGVAGAIEDVNDLNKIQNILLTNAIVSEEAINIAVLHATKIAKMYDVVYTNKIATENISIEDKRTIAIESIGSILVGIWEAIKKAVSYIFEQISKFFTWLFSSSRELGEEREWMNIKEDEKNIKKGSANTPEQVVKEVQKKRETRKEAREVTTSGIQEPEITEYINDYGLLNSINAGFPNIDKKAVETLIENLVTYSTNLLKFNDLLEKSSNELIEANKDITETSTKVFKGDKDIDFLAVNDKIEKIVEPLKDFIKDNFEETHIRQEMYFMPSTSLPFTISNDSLVDLRKTVSLGNSFKTYFGLNKGSFMYVAISTTYTGTNVIKNGAKYLTTNELEDVISKFEKYKNAISKDMKDMVKKIKAIKANLDTIIKNAEIRSTSTSNISLKIDGDEKAGELAKDDLMVLNKTFIDVIQNIIRYYGEYIGKGQLGSWRSTTNLMKYITINLQFYKKAL